MGLQIIICVETNKQCQSDFMYIKSLIDEIYIIDQANTKIRPVFMGGRGNYSSNKIYNEIAKLSKQYKGAAANNKTVVLACFDCDAYDMRPEDSAFLVEAEEYCYRKNYYFVWFCKNIENVFLKKDVSEKQKRREAIKFVQKNQIKYISTKNMRANSFGIYRSNICLVLDEILKKKQDRDE